MTLFSYNTDGYMATPAILATESPRRGGYRTAGKSTPGRESVKSGGGRAPSPPAPPTTEPHTTAPEPAKSILAGTQAAPDTNGVPTAWLKGLARLRAMQRPEAIDPRKWQALQTAAVTFETKWALLAFKAGWSFGQVFGVHQVCPTRRYDHQGLIWSVADGSTTLVGIDAQQAVFEVGRTQARQTMPKSLIFTHEQCLLWELQ